LLRHGRSSTARTVEHAARFCRLAEEEVMSDQTEDRAPAPRRPVQIPSDMKEFNRRLIGEFRATRGQLSGPMAGRRLLLLTTTGARTGEPRTTVLGYGREGDSYVVIASNNGASTHPAWYRNLLADPNATVEVGPERIAVRARTAEPRERDHLARTVPYLAQQQGLTSREIPLVVLEPESP
jgi:deazaflavin-dependent oxidoreductase (nitroreductase family)